MNRVRSESPTRREIGGKVRWIARFTNPRTGKREIAKPTWNRGKGTFDRRKDAQRAIDEAYDLATTGTTIGDYYDSGWLDRHPRAPRTNDSYQVRWKAVKDVEIEGRALRSWPYGEIRRRHVLILVDHLLKVQQRAVKGAVGVIRALSAMTEDAIGEDVVEINPFKGVRIKADDPRVAKAAREPQAWDREDLQHFAQSAPEKGRLAIEILIDTGMRIGEMFALDRAAFDLQNLTLHVHRTAHEGQITDGLKGKRGRDAGRLVPIPETLAGKIQKQLSGSETDLICPTPTGQVWRYSNFIRDIWNPAITAMAEAAKDPESKVARAISPRPHELRHSYVTDMRAAGIDDSDLAAITGHTVLTMLAHYAHPKGESFDSVREVLEK